MDGQVDAIDKSQDHGGMADEECGLRGSTMKAMSGTKISSEDALHFLSTYVDAIHHRDP